MSHEERLAAWLSRNQLELPAPSPPKGLYRPVLQSGNWLWTSGHLPIDGRGQLIRGTVGLDLSKEEGFQAALWAGLGILTSVKTFIGSLDRVKRVIKIMGLVQSAPDFFEQPAVINGCSQLFAEVFGEEHGIGVRTAFGTPTLPLGAAVEVEAIFELVAEG